MRAARLTALGPRAEISTGGGVSGSEYTRAFSTWYQRPSWLVSPPSQSLRMTSTASSSISRRLSTRGQRWPRMCSLRFSPLPTPNRKRPSSSRAAVAAAWARTAGWTRKVGQVTAVVTLRLVVAAMPPTTDHTNGLWPWLSFHG